METSSTVLMISGGVLAVVVAALVSLLLAHQPATTAMLPNAQVGAASVQPGLAPVLIANSLIPRGTIIYGATVIAVNAISTTYALALTPSDAVRLAHVKDAGRSLHLVLRSIYDDMPVRTAQTTSAPRRVHATVRQAQRAASRHQRVGM